jgi:hypothetical protein
MKLSLSKMMSERDLAILKEKFKKVNGINMPLAVPAFPLFEIKIREKTLNALKEIADEMGRKDKRSTTTYDSTIVTLCASYRKQQQEQEQQQQRQKQEGTSHHDS